MNEFLNSIWKEEELQSSKTGHHTSRSFQDSRKDISYHYERVPQQYLEGRGITKQQDRTPSQQKLHPSEKVNSLKDWQSSKTGHHTSRSFQDSRKDISYHYERVPQQYLEGRGITKQQDRTPSQQKLSRQ